MLLGLDHVTIATAKLEETVRFFVEVLGFTVGKSPDVGFPIRWLYANGRDMIHVMSVEEGRGPKPAGIDHFALTIDDLEAAKARLKRHDVPFSEFAPPGGGRAMLVCHDPNGITVELTCRRA